MAQRPVDITCRVKRDWTPDPHGPDVGMKISIKRGQTGVVYKRAEGGALVSLDVFGEPVSGWVPESYLQDGVPKDQPITYIALDLPTISGINLPKAAAGTSIFDKALTAALRSFRVEPLQERILADDAQFLRSDNKIASLVKVTLDGMPRDVRKLLEDEETDERDFYQLPELGSEDYEEGIYVLIYILEDGAIGFYVGTSQSLSERIKYHAQIIAGNSFPNNLHYAFARKAVRTYKVCLTHVSGPQNRRLLEQAFILLIGTYGKKIISREIATTNENSTHHYYNQEDALLLNSAATAAFEQVKWTPFRLRGEFFGLNTGSPMTDKTAYGERPIWVKTHYPEANMTVFRRPKLKISHKMVMLGHNAPKISARNSAMNSSATDAYCSIEIMTNGQPHEVPFARLEKLGPYSNWNQMHEMGVAITYQTANGQWVKEYHQVQRDVRAKGKASARLGYEHAMVIFTLMMQVEWINPPDFLKAVEQAVDDTYRPRIKEMVFDRFKRTVTVRDLHTIDQMQSPTIVPQQELFQKLTGPPANLHLMGAAEGRTRCDFCRLNSADGARSAFSKCKESDLSDRCQNCKVLNRPCTLTPKDAMSLAGQDMCYGRPPLNTTVYAIESPAFEVFGGEDGSDDEDQACGGEGSGDEGSDDEDQPSQGEDEVTIYGR